MEVYGKGNLFFVFGGGFVFCIGFINYRVSFVRIRVLVVEREEGMIWEWFGMDLIGFSD